MLNENPIIPGKNVPFVGLRESIASRIQGLLRPIRKLPDFISEESIINFVRSEISTSCRELQIEGLTDFILSAFGFQQAKISSSQLYEVFDFVNSEITQAGGSKACSLEDLETKEFSPKIYISSTITDPKVFLTVLSHEIFHTVLEIYFLAYQMDFLRETFSNPRAKVLMDQKHEVMAYMHSANFALKNGKIFSSNDVYQAAGVNITTGKDWYDEAASLSAGLISARNQFHNISSSEQFQLFCIELNKFILNVDDFSMLRLLHKALTEATQGNIVDFKFYLENLHHFEMFTPLYYSTNFRIFSEALVKKIP